VVDIGLREEPVGVRKTRWSCRKTRRARHSGVAERSAGNDLGSDSMLDKENSIPVDGDVVNQ